MPHLGNLRVGSPLPIHLNVLPETCLRVADLAAMIKIIVEATTQTVHDTMVKEQETHIAAVVVVNENELGEWSKTENQNIHEPFHAC